MKIEVSAFYKFVNLPDTAALRQSLKEICTAYGIRGTILLAQEGINGTIAGETGALAETMAAIRSFESFADLESKESPSASMPFARLKIRLKKEIVTLGIPGVDPLRRVGAYVAPEDWNDLITDPDVLLIDTRNSFEFTAGTFKGAIDPKTRNFGEFPAYAREHLAGYKDRKIAMFCTGGIRCEKATSFLVDEGFSQVFHLQGGILKYLETIPAESSLWQGKCFVFDERGALGHGLTSGENDKSE